MRSNKVITNTVGGELSPLMHGRSDIPVYQKGMALCENWLVLPQGGARFRNGTAFVKYTRNNQYAVFIPFQFSDQQAYLIEATDRKFRFYKDNAAILEDDKTITDVTTDAPGVVTSVAHGFVDGDEVFVSGILGMQEINAQFFLVANATVDTFTLQNHFGDDIDTSSFGAYVSGGTVGKVYEIDSPYLEVDLAYLQYAQNADTMYIVNQRYEPLKLTRAGHADWTLAEYVRTNDPFTPSTKTITGVTAATPGVVTAAAHGFVEGQEIWINQIVGMTELNGYFYTVHNPATNTFQLKDADGVVVDTVGFNVYTSGGKAFATNEYPAAVCFIDSGRLLFGGTRNNPETIWGSKAPSSGNSAFDNFTNGVNATDGITFTLAPIRGRVDSIQWLTNTSKFILIGTFSGVRLLYGATLTEPISPTSVTAKAANAPGCERALPVSGAESLFFIQRGAKSLRSLEYDFASDSYVTTDRNLVADHLTSFGMEQMAEQIGQPDIVWTVREDGRLLGLTFKEKEDISGWHRHYLGGGHIDSENVIQTYGKVLWSGIMARARDWDQVWFIVERQINGNTIRSVEYMVDPPQFPTFNEFFSGDEDADREAFNNAMYEKQKDAVHLDMVSAYDGLGETNLTVEIYSAAPPPPELDDFEPPTDWWYSDFAASFDGEPPTRLALDSTGDHIYLATLDLDFTTARMLDISREDHTVVYYSPGFASKDPMALFISPDDSKLYFITSDAGTNVVELDPTDLSSYTAATAIGGPTRDCDISTDGSKIAFIRNNATTTVYIYNTATRAVTSFAHGSQTGTRKTITFVPGDNGHVYITTGGVDIYKYTTAGVLVTTYTTGLSGTAIDMMRAHPVSGYIFGAMVGGSYGFVYNPATDTLLVEDNVTSIGNATSIQFDKTNTVAPFFAFMQFSYNVYKIDDTGNTSLSPVAYIYGGGYDSIAIDSDRQRAYITAQESGLYLAVQSVALP